MAIPPFKHLSQRHEGLNVPSGPNNMDDNIEGEIEPGLEYHRRLVASDLWLVLSVRRRAVDRVDSAKPEPEDLRASATVG